MFVVAEFFLLGGSDYRLARREDAPSSGDIGRAVIALARLQGAVSDRYLDATANDRALSADRAESLAQAVRELIREAEELRASLEAAASVEGPISD